MGQLDPQDPLDLRGRLEPLDLLDLLGLLGLQDLRGRLEPLVPLDQLDLLGRMQPLHHRTGRFNSTIVALSQVKLPSLSRVLNKDLNRQ